MPKGVYQRRSLTSRLLDKIVVDEDECWRWTGSKQKGGYATIRDVSRTRLAHRVAYESFVGPIPIGYQIDHLCKIRDCVNPNHLEAVTPQENIKRSTVGEANRSKTHCKRGHEFTPQNTRWQGSKRACRTCYNTLQRQYRLARRAA